MQVLPTDEDDVPPVEGISQPEEDGQTVTKVVYVPMWMQDYSVVYYDANLNRTVEKGGDLTEEEINSREDIDPVLMYGDVLAEPNTKVEYDLHGFIQNIYYLGGDGKYYLDPATAAAIVPLTSTGSSISLKSGAKSPPKPPMPEITPSIFVRATCFFISSTDL